jgi:hypothetical protein
MKRLFVFNFICFVFIADYNHCKNDEASERKLLKLKKIKSMAEKPVKTTAKTSLMERYSNTEKAVNLTVNNPLWSMQWHLVSKMQVKFTCIGIAYNDIPLITINCL